MRNGSVIEEKIASRLNRSQFLRNFKVLKSTKVVKKIRKITEKYSNNFWENTEVTFNLTDRISEF